MAENYLIGMAEEIKSYIPGTSSIEEGDSKITINAELKTGIKGISIAIECAPNTVKIKGTQEYKYPISEESVEEFQQEMMEKYSGCNVYVSGQVFAFSKFFSYQTVEEAVKTTEEIIDAMQDAVVTFENDCVNFLEKDVEAKEEDYNPEENVNLVHVDNAYHAVSTTMQDTEDYEEEHRKFAEKIFRDLAAEIGGTLNGNEVILTDEKEKITTDCIFFPLDAEILVSVSTPADNDAGTIYVSYSSNGKYDPQEINKLVKVYHMALEAGDNATVQDAFTQIYYFIKNYVYKTLWDNYRTLMQNRYHQEDIVQDVWIKIFSELKNYDPDKGAITTFIAPWIRHVVSDYASKNFRKTSVYYANAMKKINGAQNYCKQYGLNAEDIETIMSLTGLSEATVKNTLDLMSKKDSVSF